MAAALGAAAGPGTAGAAAALGAVAGALAYQAAWREPRSLVTPEVALALPRWPAALHGLRAALFADLHAGAGHMTPARVSAVVDACIGLGADVNLLLGDFLDSTYLGQGRARVRDVARELARIPRAFAVLGNHDWRAQGPAMRWALLDVGVRLLENEAAELRPGLWVAGTADLRHRYAHLREALRPVPEDAAVLLCTHDPDLFPRVPRRVALTVAGHVHGGQVNVPIVRHAVLPTRYGDRYLHGHVVEGGRHLYVSAGLGTAGLPLRFRRPPEIPVLRLAGYLLRGRRVWDARSWRSRDRATHDRDASAFRGAGASRRGSLEPRQQPRGRAGARPCPRGRGARRGVAPPPPAVTSGVLALHQRVGNRTAVARVLARQTPQPVAVPDAAARAQAIKDAFYGGWFEDEERALDQIRGQGPAAVAAIRAAYGTLLPGHTLERDFHERASAAQYTEALTLLLPALPLKARLELNVEGKGLTGAVLGTLLGFGPLGMEAGREIGSAVTTENEGGMLAVLRHATRAELDDAAKDRELMALLARVRGSTRTSCSRPRSSLMPDPDRLPDLIRERIQAAAGWVRDDEGAVYDALLELSPVQRRAFWERERDSGLFGFLDERQRASAQVICLRGEAVALKERMRIATAGVGTDDPAVALVVDKVAAAGDELRALTLALVAGTGSRRPSPHRRADRGHDAAPGRALRSPSDADRQARRAGRAHRGNVPRAAPRRRQRGGVPGLRETDGRGRVPARQAADPRRRRHDQRRRGLDLRRVRQPGRPASRRPAHHALRRPGRPGGARAPARPVRVRAARDARERGQLCAGPARLDLAYHAVDTDELGILRILLEMSAEDRRRLEQERPPIYLTITGSGSWLTEEEKALARRAVWSGRLPTDLALDYAFGGWGDGTVVALLGPTFDALSAEERQRYRLGYFLSTGGRIEAADDAERRRLADALAAFAALDARMQSELGTDDRQAALDRLLGTPTADELSTEQGRRMATEIMHQRVLEQGAIRAGDQVSSAILDEVAESGAIADQAEARFRSLYALALADQQLSDPEFMELTALSADFGAAYRQHVATAEQAAGIASTAAAVAVGIVVSFATAGAGTPAAASLLAAYGPAALVGGMAGATAKVVAAETVAASHYDMTGSEGLRDALTGFTEGATSVLAAGLTARFADLVGLSHAGLAAELTTGVVASSEAAIAQTGKSFALGAGRSLIEGFLSGAVGEAVLTATDERTWRQSVWKVIEDFGRALLRGGGVGAATGAVTGGSSRRWAPLSERPGSRAWSRNSTARASTAGASAS